MYHSKDVISNTIHPDRKEDLQEEARLNIKALIAGGDIEPEDSDEAWQDELERLVADELERMPKA